MSQRESGQLSHPIPEGIKDGRKLLILGIVNNPGMKPEIVIQLFGESRVPMPIQSNVASEKFVLFIDTAVEDDLFKTGKMVLPAVVGK